MPRQRTLLSRLPASLGHPRSRLDVGIALSLFLTGTVTGLLYCLFYAGAPAYYQRWFGPAVMLASGHGFANPDTTRAPNIRQFLSLQRDHLSRDDIPADTPTVPLTVEQGGHPYLLLSVGWWWRLAGISWRQVAVVNAVLYGLATVSVYAIFRLAVRRTFAVLGALLLCFSATQLENLVHLRDYAKAPFILASIAIIGALALWSMPRRRLLWLSALCGTILGIGTGFRMDVAALVPTFVLVLLLFYGDRPWHLPSDKLIALAVFALSFAGFASPVLVTASSKGSNVSHVILMGLVDAFNASLGVRESIYSFGQDYSDPYVASVVGGYAERLHDVRVPIAPFPPSTTYERMGSKYLLTLAREFPADILTRFFGSVLTILELPFAMPSTYNLSVRIALQEPVDRGYALLSLLKGLGGPLALLVLLGAAFTRLKYGIFAACALLALGGVPFLQFHLRHYFYLEFVSLVSVLLLVDSLLLGSGRLLREGRSLRGSVPWIGHIPARLLGVWPTSWAQVATVFRAAPPAVRAAGRASLMGLLIVSISILPLWGLRRYQEHRLTQLFRTYLSAEKQAIDPRFETETPGRILMTWDGAQGRAFGAGHYLTDYYMAEVVSDKELAIGAIGLRYRAGPWNDFSRTIVLTFRQGTNRIFFPVYSGTYLPGVLSPGIGLRRFIGLEVSENLRGRLRGVYRVTELRDKPLLLDVYLAADWEHARLFQTLRRWETPASSGPTVYAAFQPGSVAAHGWIDLRQSTALLADGLDVEWSDATMVKAEGRHILVNGEAKGKFHYLVQFKKAGIRAGAFLIARGRLERGGLAVGLLKDDQWYSQVVIDQPGEFIAVVEVAQDGMFAPLITNATDGGRDRSNRFLISDVGILDPKDSQ